MILPLMVAAALAHFRGRFGKRQAGPRVVSLHRGPLTAVGVFVPLLITALTFAAEELPRGTSKSHAFTAKRD